MSKRSDALRSASRAARAAGGSHLTIEARERTLRNVVNSAHNRGQKVPDINKIREKHIAAWVREQQSAGRSNRTLQTQLSAIRSGLRAAGRDGLAKSTGISNTAFGINNASRVGTRAPATAEQANQAYQAAAQSDPGLAAMVRLQQTLGLRVNEAMHAGPSLSTWQRQISAGERVSLTFGSKGGRPRSILPIDRQAAAEAVAEAKQIASNRNGRLLQHENRKEADKFVRNQWNRQIKPKAGITSHQLRNSYAQAAVQHYEANGLTRAEALARTSLDLGHGDGRGRWVERVYLAKT